MKMINPGTPRLRPLSQALLCVALLLSLQGCVGIMVGSAVMGAVASADRRTLGAQTDDKSITVKAELQIPKVAGPDAHVNIASFNRRVLLTGEVHDEASKTAVERTMRAIDGVIAVDNQLTIGGPANYTSRSSDALITTKIKSGLVEMKTISATSFKVVTENGTVYLMGRVTQREGQIAADIARGTSGVTQVVKMFEYITEDELKAMSPTKSSTAL
jgi:osmotically-inducible protein OsmY